MLLKFYFALPVVAVLAACAVDAMPEPSEGEVLFAENCTSCHGRDARGGILVGRKKAPNLTEITARHGGVFPRAVVMSQIDGYGRGKLPREQMPEFGALLAGEQVPVEVDGVMTPTPRSLAALLYYLESIQGS